MTSIKSRIINTSDHILYMVMETKVNGVPYYCCWSGGEMPTGSTKKEDILLTDIGESAMHILVALPVGKPDDPFYIQELKLGETPLRKKVTQFLKTLPAKSKVCFVGDMAGTLDGHMIKAFNLNLNEKIRLSSLH